MPDSSQLLNDLLLLSPSERAQMAVRLIQSLEDQFDENVDEEWANEIKRRLDEIDSGEVAMVPWAEVRQSVRGENSAHGS